MIEPVNIVKLILVILFNIAFFAASIIFYQLNSENRPMNFQDLANVNHGCGVEHTSLDYQQKALLSCCLIQAFFGFVYGMWLLKFKDRYHIFGWYDFTSTRHAIQYHIVAAIFAIVPAVVFDYIIPKFT